MARRREALLQDGPAVWGGRLAAATGRDTWTLREAIAAAAGSERTAPLAGGRPIALAMSGREPLATEPGRLAQAFRLTPAEARLLAG